MTSIRFYGGVNEIGGNKILVEDRGTKIFFDFGHSFGYGAEYFTGFLTPRAIKGLGDHFEFGLMPKIPGLYAEEQLATTDLPYREPDIGAVFLSHARFDHVNHICFVDTKIPVYLGSGTSCSWNRWKRSAPSSITALTTIGRSGLGKRSKSAAFPWSPSMWTTAYPPPTGS